MENQATPSSLGGDLAALANHLEERAERLYDQLTATTMISERDAYGIELTADRHGHITGAKPSAAIPAGQAWVINRDQP